MVDGIVQTGGEARAFSLDVSNAQSVKDCFDTIAEWPCPT